ncbi:hypothetical protein [Borreliella lusitaniae]|uniref:hypothetical protein n=1 Tax=Borreliella lusitaniae TaxID=100177 RepID=UPI003C77E66B
MKITIEKLKITIEKLKITIEKLKITIEKLKITIEKLKNKIVGLIFHKKEAQINEKEYIKCDINDFIFIYIL